MNISIDTHPLALATLRAAWSGTVTVELTEAARARIRDAERCIQEVIAGGRTVYGINTGFGQLAGVRIGDDALQRLQENLVRSHAVGVGADLDDEIVRLILVLKIASLAQGYSGVRVELVDMLTALVDHDVYPRIPAQGSVGASGDLAPLAHLAGVLIGAGEARIGGTIVPATVALNEAGVGPLTLAPKEGLALLNGTQVSTALALSAVFRSDNMIAAALAAGALSADAIKGSDTPFDERIQALRRHQGQIDVARVLRDMMRDSEIRASHLSCDRVQDPYSIRCMPQVIGACVDALRHVAAILETEANAVTDNPLVFTESGDVLSGGNFHAEPVALAADYLALAIAEVGALSERRIALLIDSHLSGLPAFLVDESGVNSGFMMAQVTAAALASENKALAHPASVDSLPTSANQEDHVSMATFAARRLHTMIDNVVNIAAIELLAAAQGVEFHRPQRTSPLLEGIIDTLRELSPPYAEDRSLSGDVARIAALIDDGEFCDIAREVLPSLTR